MKYSFQDSLDVENEKVAKLKLMQKLITSSYSVLANGNPILVSFSIPPLQHILLLSSLLWVIGACCTRA